MRTPHYWKKAGPASAPSNIVVVDAECWHGKHAAIPGGEHQRFRLGCAIGYRLERSRRTRISHLTFWHPTEFWDFVRSRLCERRPLWVFAHNTGYDLGSICGWQVIFGKEYECDDAILTQTMLLIRGKYHGAQCNFADTGNYYHCPLSEVGKAVGITKLPMPDQAKSDLAWVRYCRNDVEIAAAGIDALIAFSKKNELGPWGPSIASLAYNAYRSRFMKHKVLTHCVWDDIRIERNAYCGGITEPAFVGRVPFSPVHELDVNSMYAAQCLKPLPFRRISHSYKVGPKKLLDTPPGQQVIADVTIDHDTLTFPCKTKKGTYYPTGRYRTCLAHPELMVALRAGAVKWVHQAVWYAAAPIFADYMTEFSAKKIAYDREGNQAFRTLTKYYLTNLYGKTGQTTPTWTRWGEESLKELERVYGYKPGTLEYAYEKPEPVVCRCGPDREVGIECCMRCGLTLTPIGQRHWHDITGKVHTIRDWWGYTEIKGERYESRDSCPAIAATVTSYARVFLRRCQAIAGPGHWCYSDTDSVWVSDAGLMRLRDVGLVESGKLGLLDLKESYQSMIVYGPKDYETPVTVKLKGVKPLDGSHIHTGDTVREVKVGDRTLYLIRTPDGEFRQTQFQSASSQIKEGKWDGVRVKYLTKKLSRRLDKCVVEADGWTRPLRFPEEMP